MGFNLAGVGCPILKQKQQNLKDLSVRSKKSTCDSSVSSCSSAHRPPGWWAQGSGPVIVQGIGFTAPVVLLPAPPPVPCPVPRPGSWVLIFQAHVFFCGLLETSITCPLVTELQCCWQWKESYRGEALCTVFPASCWEERGTQMALVSSRVLPTWPKYRQANTRWNENILLVQGSSVASVPDDLSGPQDGTVYVAC